MRPIRVSLLVTWSRMEAPSDILSKGDLNFLSRSHFLKTLVYTVSIIVTFLLEDTFLWINVNKSCMLIEQKKISLWSSQSFRWPIWFFLITCILEVPGVLIFLQILFAIHVYFILWWVSEFQVKLSVLNLFDFIQMKEQET